MKYQEKRMDNKQKRQFLERLIETAKTIEQHISSDPNFKSWKDLCERTLFKLYGEKSKELEQFNRLKFFYNPGIWISGQDYSQDNRWCFDRDFNIAMKMFEYLLDELDDISDVAELIETKPNIYNRLFISHASEDREIVEEIIDLLESIGLTPAQIFCSSFDGYGVPLGENFFDVLKNEISNDVLVLFIFTHNFYKSPFCLCEMGATWVLSKENIPIIIPPFTFDDIEGVISKIQGLIVDDEPKLNLLREKIINAFNIMEQPMSSWERKRDRVIERIRKIIK
jgi:hypothetical protein